MDASSSSAQPVRQVSPVADATEPAAVEAAPETEAVPSPAWSPARRLGFRLLVCYFVLYTFPFPLDMIPWLGNFVSGGVRWVWVQAGTFLATRVFGIEELFTGPTGSGDTTLDYLKLLMMATLALVAAVVWTLVDRKRRSYHRAAGYFEMAVRYLLGLTLLSYGLAKVIPTQFTTPSLDRLLQPLGDFSPMGLLWTFMGFSPAYTIFAGASEVLGGMLLFFRRTRMLGAMVVTAVMTNVVAMNFFYDVPVKLYSSHLLLAALGLLALDARRLIAFFFRNEAVPPARHPALAHRRWVKIAAWTVAFLLVATMIHGRITGGWEVYHSWGAGRERPALYGIHDVERFVADGEEVPPLLTDESRWRALVIDRSLPIRWGEEEYPGNIIVLGMDGTRNRHGVILDEEARTMTRVPPEHRSLKAAREAGVESFDVLTWERPEEGVLEVTGTWEGREIEVRMTERDLAAMELPGRGFRWINEYPHNR